MLKKLNTFLNIVIGLSLGSLIGYCVYTFNSHLKNPDIYATYSAPWYTGIIIYGMLTTALILISIAIKYAIKNRKE